MAVRGARKPFLAAHFSHFQIKVIPLATVSLGAQPTIALIVSTQV